MDAIEACEVSAMLLVNQEPYEIESTYSAKGFLDLKETVVVIILSANAGQLVNLAFLSSLSVPIYSPVFVVMVSL